MCDSIFSPRTKGEQRREMKMDQTSEASQLRDSLKRRDFGRFKERDSKMKSQKLINTDVSPNYRTKFTSKKKNFKFDEIVKKPETKITKLDHSGKETTFPILKKIKNDSVDESLEKRSNIFVENSLSPRSRTHLNPFEFDLMSQFSKTSNITESMSIQTKLAQQRWNRNLKRGTEFWKGNR